VNAILLDTVGLLALWDDSDQWHAAAVPVFVDLLTERRPLVATTTVLLECGNAASRRTYRSDVCDLRQKLLDQKRLIEPTPEEIEGAWKAYRAGVSGEAGIVDLISFAVMSRLGITEAFTNDKHFAAAGFKVLF
jgi:predicted nucleic acid-binding protein